MINKEVIVKILITFNHMLDRPYMYFSNLKSAEDVLRGFSMALGICIGENDSFRIRGQVIQSRGWTWSSLPPWEEMRKAGMTEEEIIHQIVDIELSVWQRVIGKIVGNDEEEVIRQRVATELATWRHVIGEGVAKNENTADR